MTLACPTRRQILLGLTGVAVVSLLPSKAQASRATHGVKELSFYNRHTGERGKGDFWVDGKYQQDTMKTFEHVLRDHRRNLSAPMDKRLYDLLFKLQQEVDFKKDIHVISAYRSPMTNQMLAAHSKGVAKKSYHMKGMAMDIAMPGIQLKTLHDAAKSLKLGGVGFYPSSGFIHVDCGPVRAW